MMRRRYSFWSLPNPRKLKKAVGARRRRVEAVIMIMLRRPSRAERL
jgi:hypothetical protein